MAFDEHTLDALKVRLDECFSWPCPYVFKFIVGRQELPEVAALFPGVEVSIRNSRHGKYVSVTAELTMETSAAVITVYRRASRIKGLIAL
jgi:uncharacterized protein